MRGSIVSEGSGGAESRADGARTAPGTLPPDWLARLMAGEAEALRASLPTPLRVPEHMAGSRAEEHAVRADLRHAMARGDPGAERNGCARLAALLWSRGVSRREAIALTRRAVALRDDDETRLLLAARLELLGLFANAAAAIAPCVSRASTAREAAGMLIRMAVDQVRATDPQSAMKNLLEACTVWPNSGETQDLAGTLAGALGLPETSTIFLEAADRYEAAGEAERAFTARRRAFEFAPSDVSASETLAATLREMQRHEAADAVLRRHARSSGADRAHDVHIARIEAAVAAEDGARAMVAVIDGRLEGTLDGAAGRLVDEAFSLTGLHDLVMLRGEFRAMAAQGAERARLHLDLASLYQGRLGTPERALEAWIAALEADPTCGEARASLRTHARSLQDQTALVEGLLRAAAVAREGAVAIDCLGELAKLAEDRLAEPSLALWAYARMAQLGAAGEDLEQARSRLAPRVRVQDAELASAREAADGATGEARLEAVRRIASMLRGRPDELAGYLDAQQELVESSVVERRLWLDFERAASRAGRLDRVSEAARRRLDADLPRADVAYLRTLLVWLALRRGDLEAVALEAQALAQAVPGVRMAPSAAWLSSALRGDDQARAAALEQTAALLTAAVKATLLAAAGELHVELGAMQQAHRLAEEAQQVDASASHVLAFLCTMAALTRDPAFHREGEKAWSIYLPDGEHHQGLAQAFAEAGDPLLAHMWVRRWLDLRPWDEDVLQRLVDSAAATRSAEVLSAALGRVRDALLPSDELAHIVGPALRVFSELSVARAAAAALEAMEYCGTSVFDWRERFEQVAHEARAPRILVELAERASAIAPADEAARAALVVTDARLHAGDPDSAAHALVRAVAAGANPADVLWRLERLAPLSGDGRLDATTARAMALSAAGMDDEAVDQWLRVGAMRWDLGDDPVGALDAWCRALGCDDTLGTARLAALATVFADPERASEALRDHALQHAAQPTATGSLVASAALALAAGQPATANELALSAMDRDPRRTDALLVVESATEILGDAGAADTAYLTVARGAKGRFGRRAAHYRAARTLERRGIHELAIVHAIAAFEAAPAPGSALELMRHIALRVDPGEVITALRNVSDAAQTPEARAFWLLQAAGTAKCDSSYLRVALDLGLRALVASPESGATEMIREVATELVANDPADRDVLELRLQRAFKAVAPRLEGPRGGRVALSLARFSADVLEAGPLAMTWCEAALATSGDIDEYEQLVPVAEALAREQDGAARFIDAVLDRSAGMSGTTGPALYAFADALARALGDTQRAHAIAQTRAAHDEALLQKEPSYIDPFAELDEAPSQAPGGSPARRDDVFEQDGSGRGSAPGTGGMLPLPVVQVAGAETPDALHEALRREKEGALDDAIDLLERAFDREPERQTAFDEVLRRLYLATRRLAALERLLERRYEQASEPSEKVGLLLELVGLAEGRGDASVVRTRWRQLAELEPNHHDAANFLEQDALQRDDFEGLAELLRRRAEAARSLGERRALHARRATVLADELGRSAQAAKELDAVLAQHGDDAELLLLRAGIEEQDRGALSAAPFWLRASTLVVSRSDTEVLCCRAARAYLDADDGRAASEAIAPVSNARSPEVLQVLVALERRNGNPQQLGMLLNELATISTEPEDRKAAWMLEAAEAALQAGRTGLARERASRAVDLAPHDAHVQLRGVLISYRVDGLGDQGSVQTMLRRLQNVADRIGIADVPLHAFLVAEAVERLQGPETAIDYLTSRRRVAGLAPLIAIGLADRLAALGDPQAALPFYQSALAGDDLQGVRSRTQVAFQAARAALRVGGQKAAAPFIELVEADPAAQELAERLRVDMAEVVPPTDEMRRQLDRVARESRGSERARALFQLARLSAGRGTRAANAEADAFFAEAVSAATADDALREQIARERDAFRALLTPSQAPPPLASSPPSSAPPPPSTQFTPARAAELRAARAASTAPSQPPRPISSFPPSGPEARMPRQTGAFVVDAPSAQSSRPPVSVSDKERALLAKLAKGDLEAGDTLAELLAGNPERTHDLVAIRRRQLVLTPHSVRYLAKLSEAADADFNRPLARAVQHVAGVLTGQDPIAPPPLTSQPGDPERMLAMIFRGVHGGAAEVLGSVWTYASHLFVRDPGAYGLTGVERVAMSSPSCVGRAYAAAARTLGLGRTPMFYQRTAGPAQLAIAMLSPVAVVATGDIHEDSPALTYRTAAMLLAATPTNSLLFGLPANGIRQLLQALLTAFGPPEVSRGKQSETAVLAGELWRALPGTVQRRMHEIFREPSALTYEDAWARALQSTRRAGLLVVGDLAVALRDVLDDPGMRGMVDTSAPDAFLSLCRQSVSAADLVRFATSAEYAEARWRDDGGRHATPAAGR